MRFILVLCLVAIHSLTCLCAQERDIDESLDTRLKRIPCEDREILSKFFKRLFYHGDFLYTLLGQKPMGSIDYNLDLLAFPQFYKEPHKHLFLMALNEKGWKVWEEYKAFFPMKKYSFIKVKHDSFFGFLLIDKEKAYGIIEDNLLVFQKLVGEGACASEVLTMLCDGKFGYYHSNMPCLVTYYKALGLLYGYGEKNVEAFTERERLIQKLKSLPIEIKLLPLGVVNFLEMEATQKAYGKCKFKNDVEVTSLISELANLVDRTDLIKGTKKNNPFLPIKGSLFFGNEEFPQTKDMIKNYDNLNEKILRIHESENFLETVLGLLTSL